MVFVINPISLCFPNAVAPQISPFTFGEEEINEGETVSVQCIIAKGDNPVNISWYLNGKPVRNVHGVVVTQTRRVGSLTIEFVQADHTGQYTCIASNFAGNDTYYAVLNVKGT